jgi:FtsP/CotA-like multicopper oxidase with cupredoxin domain
MLILDSDPAGLVGPLKINGPTSMNYDIDLGPVLLSDWYHGNPFALFEIELKGDAPAVDSVLLQGKGIFCGKEECDGFECESLDKRAVCSGSHYEIDFVEGKTYKLSIVNAGTSSQFTFWIDGHNFTVVGTDFVPIEGFVTDTLNVAIGKASLPSLFRFRTDQARPKV